ncbi:MAG: glycosyltransferase family 1 protein [Patescibacteria group bacterium]
MNSYFLYVGSAYPHKNLDRLISAINLLKVNLCIASSRDVFTKRLEVNKNKYVKLLGFVPDNKLKSLYKNSIAFVFPSLSEGFGLPGIEAMKAGTLVLCSDIPVFREVYKNAAIYFNPLDSNSIIKVLKMALNLSEFERKSKITYAQKFVKRYSWHKMVKETLNVYEKSVY